MRVIKSCTFKIGTKIPYSEYPAIVHRFLEDQNLVSNRFLYYFDELIPYNKTYEETLPTGSCAKALKDCPALGQTRLYNDLELLYLTNIDIDTGCTEADILPNMKKIHRRYGFRECDLYYFDIDFFQKVLPFGRDMSDAKRRSEYFQRAFDPTEMIWDQPYGSGIRLHRYATGGNYISLSIDVLHDGLILDATPYFDAMKALLPNIRPSIHMETYLSEEEQQEIANWDKQIQPTLEASRSFFTQRFPEKRKQNNFPSNYTIAPKLKKLAQQYGFSYQYLSFGGYTLDKRTPRGHVLRIFVDSGPSRFDTGFSVFFQGLGFRHQICSLTQTPTNQKESDACAEKMLAVIAEFEKAHIPELDKFYNETPEWYIPSFA